MARLASLGVDPARALDAPQTPADRGHRALLAPRRYHLDYLVPAYLSAGTFFMKERNKTYSDSRLWRRNGLIWFALLVLLLTSFGSAYLRLGAWNTFIGI